MIRLVKGKQNLKKKMEIGSSDKEKWKLLLYNLIKDIAVASACVNR